MSLALVPARDDADGDPSRQAARAPVGALGRDGSERARRRRRRQRARRARRSRAPAEADARPRQEAAARQAARARAVARRPDLLGAAGDQGGAAGAAGARTGGDRRLHDAVLGGAGGAGAGPHVAAAAGAQPRRLADLRRHASELPEPAPPPARRVAGGSVPAPGGCGRVRVGDEPRARRRAPAGVCAGAHAAGPLRRRSSRASARRPSPRAASRSSTSERCRAGGR